MEVVRFMDLGVRGYEDAWEFQTGLHKALVDNKLAHRALPPKSYSQDHVFLVVEHPPVFTLGKSGSNEHLLLSEAELYDRGIQYFPINRGGDITFHGPGQIVGYPILDLDFFFNDVHRYVRCIEEVILLTLADYGVQAVRIPGHTGVWCPPSPERSDAAPEADFWKKNRKICAIGVHLSRWVTLHGFAFNIHTDLDYFNYIVPCGIADADKTVTSLAWETGSMAPLSDVKNCLKKHFCTTFDCELVES